MAEVALTMRVYRRGSAGRSELHRKVLVGRRRLRRATSSRRSAATEYVHLGVVSLTVNDDEPVRGVISKIVEKYSEAPATGQAFRVPRANEVPDLFRHNTTNHSYSTFDFGQPIDLMPRAMEIVGVGVDRSVIWETTSHQSYPETSIGYLLGLFEAGLLDHDPRNLVVVFDPSKAITTSWRTKSDIKRLFVGVSVLLQIRTRGTQQHPHRRLPALVPRLHPHRRPAGDEAA
jgi:hypothetical protein